MHCQVVLKCPVNFCDLICERDHSYIKTPQKTGLYISILYIVVYAYICMHTCRITYLFIWIICLLCTKYICTSKFITQNLWYDKPSPSTYCNDSSEISHYVSYSTNCLSAFNQVTMANEVAKTFMMNETGDMYYLTTE